MAATSQVFQQLGSSWDTVFTTSISATISTAISQNATLFASILTLWVIISGIATMFGRMTMADWVYGATRTAIVGTLLTTAAFAQYIQTPFQTTIPNWIATTISGGANATGPQQFDAIFNQIGVAVGHIEQQLSWTDVGQYVECAFISFFTLAELITCFCIWEFSKGMIGLLIAVAPFLLGFYLFQATRHIVLALAGQAITALITMLMVNIMVALAVTANTSYMTQIATTGGVGAQISSLVGVVGFFLFSDIIVIMIPGIAARIGGGIAHHVGGRMAPVRLTSRAIQGVVTGATGTAKFVGSAPSRMRGS
jgi:type IV secretion system protein VirB6